MRFWIRGEQVFKEYKTVCDFIIGCGDLCVENGLTSLKYGGTTDDGVSN